MTSGLEKKGETTNDAAMIKTTTIALKKTHVKAIEQGEIQHVVLVAVATEEVHLTRVHPHLAQARAARLTASQLLCLQPPLAMTMMVVEAEEAVGVVVEDVTIAQVDVAEKEKREEGRLGI